MEMHLPTENRLLIQLSVMCEHTYAGAIYCPYPFTIRYSNSDPNRPTHHSSILGEPQYMQRAYGNSRGIDSADFLLLDQLWCAQLPTDHPTGMPTEEPTLVRLYPVDDEIAGSGSESVR